VKDILRFVHYGVSLAVASCTCTTLYPLHAQWVTNGPNAGVVRCLTVAPADGGSGGSLFAGTSDDLFSSSGNVFLSTNDGMSWTAVDSTFMNNRVNALAATGPYRYAGTPVGIFRSTNNGTSWTDLNVGFSNNDIHAFAISPGGGGGTNLFAGTYGGGVYHSTNNGAGWTGVSTGLTNPVVIALAVGGTVIFAGTFGSGVFRSTNNGNGWAAADSGLTGNHVPSFAVSYGGGGTNDTILFAGTNNGVFRSTDGGTHWIAAGLQDTLVSALAVTGTNLFAGTSDFLGTSGGVFLSTNNGIQWTAVNTGLPNAAVLALAVSLDGANLFAGTSSGDVWRRPLSEMITLVEQPSIDVPANCCLDQNYPNPFNPSTRIRFQLADPGFVSLKVFDTLGKEVAVLVAGELPAGSYSEQWNAAGFASGVYLCHLQAGAFAETRKLLLLR
jgi:hypothetical protein